MCALRAHISKILSKIGVFWVKIAKFKVNLHYTYCSKLIGEVRRETEFRQWRCRNSAKKKQEREYATEIQSGSRERGERITKK